MYENFYGLREKPFNLLPDPDYLYMSRGHENAYTHLEYAVSESKGFVVITGEIGSGKTTLINFLLRKIGPCLQIGIVNHTDASPSQFMRMVCQEYELNVEGLDKAGMLETFNHFLLAQFASKKRVVLIIDEAQNLSPRTLEEIRMLSNLEAEKHHLIQIIMVGQPELRLKLQQKGMAQLAQRVTVHCHLDGLSPEETDRYIRHRLKVAGAGDLDLFQKDAISSVHNYTRGIPRLINILCDAALVYGYADSLRVIDGGVIKAAIEGREAGGMFDEPADSGPSTEMSGARPQACSRPAKEVIELQRRVLLLENMVGSLDMRLNTLTKARDDRDVLVFELLKTLKESFESRFRTLLKFVNFSKKVNRDLQLNQEGEGKKIG